MIEFYYRGDMMSININEIKLNKKSIIVISILFFLLIGIILFFIFSNNENDIVRIDVDENGNKNVNLTEYQGDWYTEEKKDKSSKIEVGDSIKSEGSLNQFKIDLSILGFEEFKDVIVTVTGTAGTFVAPHNTMGGLSFHDDYIQVIISHSDLEIEEGTIYKFMYNK